MKNIMSVILLFISLTASAYADIKLTNVKGEVLIKGVYHSVTTNDDGDNTGLPSQITFSGKVFTEMDSASSTHAGFETVENGILTKVTLYRFKFDDTWSWLKNTVFNSAESTCNPDSEYFFTISKKAVGTGYAFYGNCFNTY